MNVDGIIKSDIRSSLTKSGLLLFLAGFTILMSIITSEIFFKKNYTTRDNYISELGAPMSPEGVISKPSAEIFNYSLIASGLMIMLATFFIQKIFKKLITTIPIGLFGTGILGVGIFPGNIAPWHMIFAVTLFIAGGVGAITSYKITSAPIRYLFICLGIATLAFLFGYKYFIPSMGVGGAERWVFYPAVFWLTGLGGYLLGIKDEYRHMSHVKPE
ncbi:MAG: DUF998 domain-containing protein [Bacteroidales bacterium]|nr:DUF998 domain-containing protein [Bacteroidales bacterium]